MSFDNFTVEQMEREIASMEHEIVKRKARADMPKVERATVASRWTRFCNLMDAYVESVAEGNGVDDSERYIYEEACKLAFGDRFFEWYDKVAPR